MFKNLNLNRERILESIDEFFNKRCNNYKRSDFIKMDSTRNRVEIEYDDINLFIDFRFRHGKTSNGGTTIEVHSGQHLDIKRELAEYIINDNKCVIGNLKDKDSKFIVSGIDEKDFNVVVALIKESNYYKKDSYKEHQYHYQYTFIGNYDEKLTVNYYFTTKKIMIQGRPLLLFYDSVTLITELLDPENIPSVFNTMYELNIEEKNIIDEYDIYFPNSSEEHNDKLKTLLYQSIYNLHLNGTMFCYEGLVLPALRALEGHLKILLFRDYGIECKDKKFLDFKEIVWCEKEKAHSLGENYVKQIGDEKIVEYVNDAYNYYNTTRHSLVHYDSPNEYDTEGGLSRTIDSFSEAEGIIRNIINKIDEYYLLKRE